MKVYKKIRDFFDWLFHAEHSIWMGRIPFSLLGRKWEIHITDDDCWPSVPHLHAIENPCYKINVYTGDVYYKKMVTGKLREKELSLLWKNKSVLSMIKKARKYYKEKHPSYILESMPSIKNDDIDDRWVLESIQNKEKLEISYAKKKKRSN